ncbi:MAG: PEP-CTERM sorting domain-containing protein [Chthoniobacterales bacterium]
MNTGTSKSPLSFLIMACIALVSMLVTATTYAQIYVSQSPGTSAGSVLQFDAAGHFQDTFLSGLSINVYGLSVDASNNVYTSDFGGYTVYKNAPDKTQLLSIFANSTSSFQAVANATNIYVAYFGATQVDKYTSAGTGATLAISIASPAALAFDPTGTYLYAASYSATAGASKIVRYNVATGFYADFITGLTGAAGLAVDSSGNLYVSTISAAGATDVVTRYDSSGHNGTTFASSLTDPYGLAIADGYLYVANAGANSVGRYLLSNGSGSSTFINGLTYADYGVTVAPSPIPEPSSIALLCIGGVAFASWRLRRRNS